MRHLSVMSEATGATTKSERTTEMLCHTVARGISEIVRFSVDEDFRRKSFKILKASSTNELEKKIYESLLASKIKPTSVNHFSSSDEEKDNELIHTHHLNKAESSKAKTMHSFDGRGEKQRIIDNKNWLEMLIQKKQDQILMRQNNSTENQVFKWCELFPNNSEDYPSNTQRWDIARYSQ